MRRKRSRVLSVDGYEENVAAPEGDQHRLLAPNIRRTPTLPAARVQLDGQGERDRWARKGEALNLAVPTRRAKVVGKWEINSPVEIQQEGPESKRIYGSERSISSDDPKRLKPLGGGRDERKKVPSGKKERDRGVDLIAIAWTAQGATLLLLQPKKKG